MSGDINIDRVHEVAPEEAIAQPIGDGTRVIDVSNIPGLQYPFSARETPVEFDPDRAFTFATAAEGIRKQMKGFVDRIVSTPDFRKHEVTVVDREGEERAVGVRKLLRMMGATAAIYERGVQYYGGAQAVEAFATAQSVVATGVGTNLSGIHQDGIIAWPNPGQAPPSS